MDGAPSRIAPLAQAAGPSGGIVHASAVALNGRGLLIAGPSGSGKSALALQMIAQGASLIADDATRIAPAPDGPVLCCPPAIAGGIEARGLGLLRLPYVRDVRLWLALCLLETPSAAPRLPAPDHISLCGADIPLRHAAYSPHLSSALVLALRHDSLPMDDLT